MESWREKTLALWADLNIGWAWADVLEDADAETGPDMSDDEYERIVQRYYADVGGES